MWGHTAKSPMIGPANASVLGFAMIWLFHMSWITLKISIFGIAVFIVLAYFRVDLLNAIGWISFKLSGGGMVAPTESARRYARRSRM
jgi:hypothetical protein